ncbi:MAG: PAS domain S-box protein [Alphaproteobacteria bacterium]|nr:PAS domain S-box protein [Alphaproteobacteria bacterium]
MDSARSLEERLRVAAGDSARGVLIVNEEGNVIFADAAAETFFQCKRGGLVGRPWIGVLAAGSAVEIGLHSATGAGALIRLSEIQWEGKAAYLATLRDAPAGMNSSPAPDAELHYRDIVQNTPDLVLISRGGRLAYINEAGVKLLKAASAEQLHGRVVREFFHPAFHDKIQERVSRLLRAPSVAPLLEEQLVALDGSVVDVEVRAASFYSQGELVLQVICRDISERKAAERALRASAERFQQLAEAMPQIVWTTPPGGGIDYVSDAFYTYTGVTKVPGEAPGYGWLNAVHPDDLEQAIAVRDKGQTDGVPFTMDFRLRRHDGQYRWHFVSAVPVRDDDGTLVKWFGTATDIHDQRVTEEKANRLAVRLLATLESITDAFVTLDRDWRVTYMNKEAERLLRVSRKDLLGQIVWDHFEGAEAFKAQFQRAVEENRMIEFEEPYAPLELWVEARAHPSEEGLAIYFRDVTERRELQSRLRQSQRLEAVGQLTGGIAHDFNNLLTVIMGNAETLMERLSDPPIRKLAEMTMSAAERGSELTNRLLAFARRQTLDPKAVDVNALVESMDGLLRRTLGEHVEIVTAPRADLWPAFVDAAQLEAALLNLCINARDAMPDGGKLTIEAANVALDDTYARGHEEVAPGNYVMIAVSDTGCGMSPGVVARAFEPFFTTKEVGKGTGLGLSMVHGFVKQSGGHVKIYTEVGHGTTVKLYVPRATGSSAGAESGTGQTIEGGSERVLLVEDDDQVRNHVTAQVAALGYQVVAVATASDALGVLDKESFDLLFTDVVIPGGMNGPQLAREALRRAPDMRVLFTSGYTENAIMHHGRLDPGVLLLNKPYRRIDLAVKIRQALASPAKV